MPATPERIAFITQEYRLVTTGPDSSVVTKYGKAARDTTDPVPTKFSALSDAQVICNERHNLLKADRRRFQVNVAEVAAGESVAYLSRTPAARIVDPTRLLDADAAIADIRIDYQDGTTQFLTWG